MDVRSIAENIIDCQIDLVNVGERFRQDFGDIPALAQSIEEIGLLQPIGIDSGYRLVFGERRLRAFRHLGRDTIPARFVNLDSLLKGEYAENELRKDFTQSERVAIGRALEGELREKADARKKSGVATLQENFPEGVGQTRDLAAKAAGFGNGKTYEQAKAVVDSGAPELIEAMDTGRASISAAAAVATLPKEEQAGLVARGEAEIIAKAKEIKAARHAVRDAARREAKREATATTAAAPYTLRRGDAFEDAGLVGDVDLLITDPPYSTDVQDIEAFTAWMDAWLPKVKATGRAYIFTGAYPGELRAYLNRFAQNENYGLVLDNVLVWTYRNTIGPSTGRGYKLNWQACFYLHGREASDLNSSELVEKFTVQDVNAPDARTGVRYHAWQKPDELAERLVAHGSQLGDTVADPFAGTGTFIAAAAKLGRVAFGIDASPDMLALCCERGLEVAR